MSKQPIFTGSGVAIVTPFTEHGTNYDKLRALIDWHVASHTDAIIICGTTGEASTMPDAEHVKAIACAVEHTAGRIPVIAGVGSNDTAHCIDLAREAESAGADGLLVVTPYYNKATQKGLTAHFKALNDAVHTPIILYNVPSRTGMGFTVDTLTELAKCDNIVGVKEASGNIAYAAEVAARCPELDLYSGNDDMIVPMLSLGGKGVISVLANVMPQETHDICQLWFDGEVKQSAALQLKLFDLVKKLFIEVNPIPVKTAMNLMGMEVGPLRLPLCEMEEKNLLALKAAMVAVGLKVQ